MHRRALLVALGGLSGCTGLVGNPFGGGSGSTDRSGGSGGAGGSSDAAPSDSDSGDGPTGTGTESGTGADAPDDETPSPADLRRMSVADLLVLSRDELSLAVEAYADAGGGDSLTAVTAAADTFDPRPVVDHLYRARRAYEAADRQGLSTETQEEISRLERVEEFVRLCIDAQVLLVEAHDDLEDVVAAIEYVDPESARSLTDRASARQTRTRGTVTSLSNVRYERSVGVVDALSREEYLAKRDQFAAETRVLDAVVEALPSVVDGVRLFARARGRRQSGAPYAAADLGRDAETAFARGVTALRDAGSRIPRGGQGFGSVVSALRTAAEDKRDEARAFYRDIET